MSLQDFPENSSVIIYTKAEENGGIKHENIMYNGLLKYIPNGNLSGYFFIRIAYHPKKPYISTRGKYINEVFQIPIIARPK